MESEEIGIVENEEIQIVKTEEIHIVETEGKQIDYENLIIGSQSLSCFSGATSFWNWSSLMLLNCSLRS